MPWLSHLILLGFLILYTVQDIRSAQIWWPAALLMASAGLLYQVSAWGSGLGVSLGGLGAGALLGMLCLAGKGAIGWGDVITVAACGIWLGFGDTFSLLLIALFIASGYAIILLLRGKGKKARFPFVPFLLGAYLLELILPIS